MLEADKELDIGTSDGISLQAEGTASGKVLMDGAGVNKKSRN